MLSEDKLFATLDPTTRRLRLPTNQNALLSDTVGFIRKLPHQLVESFKATLEEVVEADILMHVVDVSNSGAAEQIQAVNEVLKEIDGDDKPTLMVFNKVDQLSERNGNLHWLRECVGVNIGGSAGASCRVRPSIPQGLPPCARTRPPSDRIPAANGAAQARVRALGQIDEERYEDEWVHLRARIPAHAQAEFAEFQQETE